MTYAYYLRLMLPLLVSFAMVNSAFAVTPTVRLLDKNWFVVSEGLEKLVRCNRSSSTPIKYGCFSATGLPLGGEIKHLSTKHNGTEAWISHSSADEVSIYHCKEIRGSTAPTKIKCYKAYEVYRNPF
jgi:hypothetical protein